MKIVIEDRLDIQARTTKTEERVPAQYINANKKQVKRWDLMTEEERISEGARPDFVKREDVSKTDAEKEYLAVLKRTCTNKHPKHQVVLSMVRV